MRIVQCQSQQQIAVPQTILSRQLLLLPVFSLESFLSRAVTDNPFLELCEDGSQQVILCGAAPADHSPRQDMSSEALPLLEEICGSQQMSLQDILCMQARMLRGISRQEQSVLEWIIQAIDSAGYLRESTEEISAATGCPRECAERLVELVQSFFPQGVGARTLSECLLLQMDPSREDAPLLRQIISQDLENLAQHRYIVLEKKYHISPAQIQDILRYIRTMNPRPGASYAVSSATPFIYPDASVRLVNRKLTLEIFGSARGLLRFDAGYMAGVTDQEAVRFLEKKRNEAICLLNSLEMRYQAMSRLLCFLMDAQREFLLQGPQFLRPLALKDAAEAIGMSPSTVSRCVSGTFLDTPWGIYPLRHLFQTESGAQDSAADTVRRAIGKLIAGEDKTAPLSDQAIAAVLESRGLTLSRRTVSKYRQEMGIVCQRMRRQS